jgi:hypothetical protein
MLVMCDPWNARFIYKDHREWERKKNTKLGTLDVQPTSLAGPGDVNEMDPPSLLCNLPVAGQRK